VYKARTGDTRNVHSSLTEKSTDLRLLGRSKQRWNDNIKMNIQTIGCKAAGYEFDSSGSEYGPVTVSCEHGSEASNFIERSKFRDQLSNYQPLKKDYTAWS
jgi:hypothetical protein